MSALDDAVRSEGVVWRPCDDCGRDWPFPKGFHASREWACAACAFASAARLARDAEQRLANVKANEARVRNHYLAENARLRAASEKSDPSPKSVVE